MKILMITPYVTIAGHKEFERNKTGFGYMVHDIAKAIGITEQVDVLATDSRGEAFDINGVHYLKRSYWLMLKNISKCIKPGVICKLMKQFPSSRGTRVRLWYYWAMTGYLDNLIKNGSYDIVHIHGCSLATELWIQICKKHNQKFIVTLHGLNSFSDTVKLEKAGKQYERNFLARVVNGEFPITVISTGMKKKIEHVFNKQNCSNINVVCNAFSFVDITEKNKKSIRERHKIPYNAKLFLYVGNISTNKNQIQIVRAYALLPKDLQEKIYVLFCGNNLSREETLYETISQYEFLSHLIICGNIDKHVMPSYYQAADGVALLSIAEGFGLSLIEGMHFGLPCIMFSDMDAFEDIYISKAVVPIEKRDDNSVALALTKLYSNRWDSEEIKKYSERFSSEAMARNYINAYHNFC